MHDRLPPEHLLWSFSDTTMLRAWKQTDALHEWLTTADALYQRIADTPATLEARVLYLRTLAEAIHFPSGAYAQAITACTHLLTLLEPYRDHWDQARWIAIDVCGILLALHHATSQHEREEHTLAAGKHDLAAYATWIEHKTAPHQQASNTDQRLMQHRWWYSIALANFGCQCLWTEHSPDAVAFLTQALKIQDVPETHFFLASALLQANGDTRQSLEHFRRAVENPSFSRRHDLRQAFHEEQGFAAVWNDGEFLTVIETMEDKISRQVASE
jgi:tetratricopeptide (TPR) repeat protein